MYTHTHAILIPGKLTKYHAGLTLCIAVRLTLVHIKTDITLHTVCGNLWQVARLPVAGSCSEVEWIVQLGPLWMMTHEVLTMTFPENHVRKPLLLLQDIVNDRYFVSF